MDSLRSLVGVLLLGFCPAALAQVELLYVAAADCGFCRRWEAKYLERGQPRAALDAAGRTTLRGTPWFALFVDGEVRVQAFGVNAFETRIQPALRSALHEKT